MSSSVEEIVESFTRSQMSALHEEVGKIADTEKRDTAQRVLKDLEDTNRLIMRTLWIRGRLVAELWQRVRGER